MIAVRNEFLSDNNTNASVSNICKALGVPRSTAYYQPRPRKPRPPNQALTKAIKAHIDQPRHASHGTIQTWANIRWQGWSVGKNTVHNIMKREGWTLTKRAKGMRPRVQFHRSVAEHPNQRWATDLTRIYCGNDGWCVFAPVIDCCTRELLGWELAPTGNTRTALRALEMSLLHRFGWLHSATPGLTLRHDNGLVFGSRQYMAMCKSYGLTQEFSTPYTPEDNGMCERVIRTFKEEVAWVHSFRSIVEARQEIASWVTYYNHQRPHSALNHMPPTPYLKSLSLQLSA